MATTDVEICNLALSRIGVRELLQSLTEPRVEASQCSLLYPLARDTALASAWWPFATRRATLTLPVGLSRSGWAYVYALPADFLAPRYLYPEEARQPFALEANDTGDGQLLLTDVEGAELVYTAQATVVRAFSPLFVDALAWLLASELALALPVKPDVAVAAGQRWEMRRQAALAAALSERQPRPAPDSELITVRG